MNILATLLYLFFDREAVAEPPGCQAFYQNGLPCGKSARRIGGGYDKYCSYHFKQKHPSEMLRKTRNIQLRAFDNELNFLRKVNAKQLDQLNNMEYLLKEEKLMKKDEEYLQSFNEQLKKEKTETLEKTKRQSPEKIRDDNNEGVIENYNENDIDTEDISFSEEQKLILKNRKFKRLKPASASDKNSSRNQKNSESEQSENWNPSTQTHVSSANNQEFSNAQVIKAPTFTPINSRAKPTLRGKYWRGGSHTYNRAVARATQKKSKETPPPSSASPNSDQLDPILLSDFSNLSTNSKQVDGNAKPIVNI